MTQISAFNNEELERATINEHGDVVIEGGSDKLEDENMASFALEFTQWYVSRLRLLVYLFLFLFLRCNAHGEAHTRTDDDQ